MPTAGVFCHAPPSLDGATRTTTPGGTGRRRTPFLHAKDGDTAAAVSAGFGTSSNRIGTAA